MSPQTQGLDFQAYHSKARSCNNRSIVNCCLNRDMAPLPRFSTVPVPRCEETDIMARKDAVLLVQPMVFYALSKNQLPIWSALHTDYPSKFLKSTPISRERAGPHSRLPTKCIPISPAIPDKPVSWSPFHKRGGQSSSALSITFASYLHPTSPFPLPCTMKQKSLSFHCPTW